MFSSEVVLYYLFIGRATCCLWATSVFTVLVDFVVLSAGGTLYGVVHRITVPCY